jgi:hypothetical protein
MFINLLRFRFKDGVPEDAREATLAAISRTAKSSAVSFSVVGRELGNPREDFTIADLASLQLLVARPRRIAMTDDADPAPGENSQAMCAAKRVVGPAWASLLSAIPDIQLQG